MKIFRHIRYLFFLLWIPIIIAFTQTDITSVRISELSNRLKNWEDTLHPQKIYLHLDKRTYYSHEHIWFKAYLLNGIDHYPDTASEQIYVELINPYKQVVQTVRTKIRDGEGDGFFVLKDTVPEGLYQIRAYTNWMKNFNPQFFFNTTIVVHNVYNKYLITRKQAKKNRKIIRKRQLQEARCITHFFPEGGQMLVGHESKVAFLSTNAVGMGVDAQGVVKDQDKNEIVRFKTAHDGMGFFFLKPKKDKSYTAYISYKKGEKEEKVPLPQPVLHGIGMQLTEDYENFYLNIFSNKIPSNDRPANEIIVFGQTRGKIYFSTSVNLLDGEQLVKIPKDLFPSGITQFTLINNRLLPIAERLAFVDHQDFLNVSVNGSRTKDSAYLSFSAPDLDQPRLGLSAAVLYGVDRNTLDSPNIISDLLLVSDLPGYIEDPNYYFQVDNDTVRKNLDLLMLTHGWKRFFWQDVIKKNYPPLTYSFEKGVTVQGKITREVFQFPYPNAEVSLYIESTYNDVFHTVTDRKGNFLFQNLNYPDTIPVKITARKPGGGKYLLIHLPENHPEKMNNYEGNYFLTEHSEMDMKAYRRRQNELLKQAMNKKERELDSMYLQTIPGRPDNVLWGKDIPPGYSDLLSAMKGRIPGVLINGQQIIIRGVGTLYGSTDPLVLLDDIPTDVSMLSNISPQDVDRVEIFKGPSTAIYGSRGGNGVIAVYTKQGSYMTHGEITFSMLGYQRNEKFHPPRQHKVESELNKSMYPVTLFWAPDLTVKRGKDAQIKFPLEKNVGKIVIIVEGTDYHGTPAYSLAVMK